jgi:signal transduction histidine kinase
MARAADDLAAFARLFDRFPQAAIGVDDELRIVFVNEHARTLLGDGRADVGRALPVSFREGARRLNAGSPVRADLLETEAGTFRVTGVPAEGREPAVLLFDEVTLLDQQTQVMQEFVRNAAHQLRTPLTAIAAAVEVLRAGAKDDPVERDRFLGHLERHTSRLTRVARGLLLLARAQSGEELRVGPVELKPVLDQLAAETVAGDEVEITAACGPGVLALAERDLLHEALAALVDNAVEHTVAGGVRLAAAEDAGEVEITISDTGPGIPAAERDRIFEPFFTARGGSDRFGLGLAVTAQAVHTMRGSIRLADSDSGTTFVVRLPRARSA